MKARPISSLIFPAVFAVTSSVAFAAFAAIAADKPAAPFANPYLADSTYNVTHTRANYTPIAGPVGPSRQLKADEIIWKPVGPYNEFPPTYSGPYPNGKRVVWVGGYDRVAKLDADTLEVLTTYANGGNTFFGVEETTRHVDTMDKLDDMAMLDYTIKTFTEAFPSGVSFYRMLTRENELILPHRGRDGLFSLQAYGEADGKDPASKISLKREWKIPAEVSTAGFFGIQMTSDGWIVIALQDGTMIALARDFSSYQTVKLPSKNGPGEIKDAFSSFVRNSMSTDDQGGIYVVTRDNMHRVQWTGSKLSLDEADGAWAAGYPNGEGVGSGTTPNLMGWGLREDHLVVIADATKGNNMMAFWRDQIPADWKGIPGFDRRVAGITKVKFGVYPDEEPQIENGLVVLGYGAFLDETRPHQRLSDRGSPNMQWISEAYFNGVPGHGANGGTKIEWDPKGRVLKTAWSVPTNFGASICTISAATEILYCWGARDRNWTLEGIDWKTGKTAFTYTLGKSHRYSVAGGTVTIAPNGAVDCGCIGGLGIARVQVKAGKMKPAS